MVDDEAARGARDSGGEATYRDIFLHASDALFIHAEDGAILEVNERTCSLFGWDHASALSLGLGQLSSGEPGYTEVEAVARVRRAILEGPQVFEWRSKKRSGDVFWSEVCLLYTSPSPRD